MNAENLQIEKPKSRPVVLAILFIVFLALSLVLYLQLKPLDLPTESGQMIIEDISEINPTDFPSGLPLEKDVKLFRAYKAWYSDKALQATASFESEKTPKEVFDVYYSWARDNGWKVENQRNDLTNSSIYITKGKEDINVVSSV